MSDFLETPYLEMPGAVWLRGNLHAHSTRSDGALDPQEVIDAYAACGHDFLALSDHDLPADYTGLDPRGMILVPAFEITKNGEHVVAVGCRSPIEPSADRQAVVDAISAAGGIAVLGHPNWEADFDHFPLARMAALSGYAGIEVYNGGILEGPGSTLATDKWDLLLAGNPRVRGFATDDSHILSNVGRGWIGVRAAERSLDALIAGIAAGSFYASSGVIIEQVAVTGSRLVITAPGAEAIAVIGPHGRRLAGVEAPELIYNVRGCEYPFFRVECVGRAGRMAWTQPFTVGARERERREQLMAERPVLRAGRAAQAPPPDEPLDGPAWRTAAWTDCFLASRTAEAPPVRTELGVLVAGGRIHVAFRCEEPEMNRLRSRVQEHGRPTLWADDGVEVFLDVGGAGQRYFQILANSAGFAHASERTGPDAETGRTLAVQTRPGRWARGWTLVLAVSLADLGAGGAPGTRWGFNAVRNRTPHPEHFSWSYTGRSNHAPGRFGWLEFA
ncbi:MAG: hypothetical protein V1809_11990 [Planctomycetota bacterium]